MMMIMMMMVMMMMMGNWKRNESLIIIASWRPAQKMRSISSMISCLVGYNQNSIYNPKLQVRLSFVLHSQHTKETVQILPPFELNDNESFEMKKKKRRRRRRKEEEEDDRGEEASPEDMDIDSNQSVRDYSKNSKLIRKSNHHCH